MNITDTSILISILGFAVPLISGVLCLMVMTVFLVQNHHRILERKLSLLLVAELTACVFCWVSMIAYTICPGFYIRIE